jgi:5-methylcytosine-specific restriction endonuclease McrA
VYLAEQALEILAKLTSPNLLEIIMSNFVFVVDSNKQPLDPIHPAQARRMLDSGQAAVFRRFPFTVILKEVVTDFKPQPLQLKIDPGSKTTGIVLLRNNTVIWAAELTHRGQAIQAALLSPRQLRRGRRSRKTRYRPARFLNRTRSKGWLAPSLRHRVDTTLTWVNKLVRLAHVATIVQELVRFDLQQMENPEISGVEYQQGELVGYECREYLLEKWNRKCAYCGVENVPLQIEHILAKANGGSDRVSSLCLACEKCNQKKGAKSVEKFLAKKPEVLKRVLACAKRLLKDAAAVNSTSWALFNTLKATGLPVATGSGGLTKFNRTRLGLRKAHWLDAACVGETPDLRVLTKQPLLIKATGHGSRQMCGTDKYGFPTRHFPRLKLVNGYRTGDMVKAIVTTEKKVGIYIGRVAVRSTGSFNVSTRTGLVQGISHKYCRIIQAKDGFNYSV